MKLDKRLSRIPHTCFEKDDCEEFVGHMGYFTDYIEDYSDLKECYHKRLKIFYRNIAVFHFMPRIISVIDFSFLMHS